MLLSCETAKLEVLGPLAAPNRLVADPSLLADGQYVGRVRPHGSEWDKHVVMFEVLAGEGSYTDGPSGPLEVGEASFTVLEAHPCRVLLRSKRGRQHYRAASKKRKFFEPKWFAREE